MKELTQAITDRMAHMVESGAVQELIDKQLQKTVADILESSLRSHSDFGKAVKDKLDTSLSNAIAKVSFPEYSHFINETIMKTVSASLSEAAVSGIQQQLKEIVAPVPKEMKAADFLGKLAGYFNSESEGVEFEDGPYIQIDWGCNSDETALYMTIKDHFKVSFYDHKKENKWYIGYIEDDCERRITADLGGATHARGVIGYLYKLYCTGTIFSDLERNQDDYLSLR